MTCQETLDAQKAELIKNNALLTILVKIVMGLEVTDGDMTDASL